MLTKSISYGCQCCTEARINKMPSPSAAVCALLMLLLLWSPNFNSRVASAVLGSWRIAFDAGMTYQSLDVGLSIHLLPPLADNRDHPYSGSRARDSGSRADICRHNPGCMHSECPGKHRSSCSGDTHSVERVPCFRLGGESRGPLPKSIVSDCCDHRNKVRNPSAKSGLRKAHEVGDRQGQRSGQTQSSTKSRVKRLWSRRK
jgi:hypothetical protein